MGTLALTSPSGLAASSVSTEKPSAAELAAMAHAKIVMRRLDNPRQLSFMRNGALLIAEAGHGGPSCEGGTCVGFTGKVTVKKDAMRWSPMTKLLSGAGPDGSFATGADGASKRVGGGWYAIMTYAPPETFPQGVPGKQAGKLLLKKPGGKRHIVANVSRFERIHNPDGEQIESNPYSVLALKKQVLVADAAGDYIASLRGGKLRLWDALPEYGDKADPVPTVISRGGDGMIYVGELHSEKRGKAKVYQYNRKGEIQRHWNHFTTVTGVAVNKRGTLFVSELFGGHCGFDQIPSCFPGRIVKVKPNGDRSYLPVPFPAGIAVKGKKVVVAAFSVAPKGGFGGNPEWSGQLWRVRGL